MEKCYFDGRCFGRRGGYCMILKEMPDSDECHFQKTDRQMTDGVRYEDGEGVPTAYDEPGIDLPVRSVERLKIDWDVTVRRIKDGSA